MSTSPPPRQADPSHAAQLDARLIQWMAVQALEGRHARLMDAGAGPNVRMDLARIFIDLPVRAHGGSSRSSKSPQTAMPLLLTRPAPNAVRLAQRGRIASRAGWLLVGGPGSGKSTLTTMVAQVLRLPWIERQVDALPDPLRKKWSDFQKQFRESLAEFSWLEQESVFPIRIDLPTLAKWLGGRQDDDSSLWEYLASQATRDLRFEGIDVELSTSVWQSAITSAGPTVWILDGLDEVSRSAGRERVIQFVRKTISSSTHGADGLLVATRPQGYTGEFDELDDIELIELDATVARHYAEKLLRAWTSGGSAKELDQRLRRMEAEFERTEIADLLTTPLHTTLAALLVCTPGKLPSAQCELFDAYFDMIFERELGKPFDQGIQVEERAILRQLHARAGLALHVRAQEGAGVDPSLRRRNVREILTQIYKDQGYSGDELQTRVERMMRFATDRLVLLLHSSEGEYSFGVRSLQEYFAADALLEGETEDVRKRIEKIVLDPHWSNVFALMTSRLALAENKREQARALRLTASVCEDLNAGRIGGEAAKRCFMGSRLAMDMLEATQKYGGPWLHAPLGHVALQVAESYPQSVVTELARIRNSFDKPIVWTETIDVHVRLGGVAAVWAGPNRESYLSSVIDAAATHFKTDSEDAARAGWRLLQWPLALEHPGALQLAQEHSPSTAREANQILSALLGTGLESPWLWAFLAKHQDWYTPPLGYQKIDVDNENVPLCVEFHEQIRIHANTFNLQYTYEWLQFHFITIGGDQRIDIVEKWKSLAERAPTSTLEWCMWKRVATFYAEPSHVYLAEICEAVTNEDVLRDLKNMGLMLPWPVRACLDQSETSEEVCALAMRARAGDLGTVDDWRAAETRWRNNPNVSLDDIEVALCMQGPWLPDIATRGIVLSPLLITSVEKIRSSNELSPRIVRCIEEGKARHRLVYGFYGDTLTPDVNVSLRIARLADAPSASAKTAILRNLALIVPDLEGPDKEVWFELLDVRGRAFSNRAWSLGSMAHWRVLRLQAMAKALMLCLRDRRDQWGLLEPLLVVLIQIPYVDLSALQLPDLPSDAPARACAIRQVLALVADQIPAQEVASTIRNLHVDENGQIFDFRRPLAHLLRFHQSNRHRAIELLCMALDIEPAPTGDVRENLLGSLFIQLRDSITPAFTTPESWTEHALDAPFLSSQSPQLPPRLVRIEELRNIRLFKEVPLVKDPFPTPNADHGQWIVFIGENGAGKTTLLRALALTLAPPAIASKLLDEKLSLLTNGSEGRVEILLESGPIGITLRRQERTEVIESNTPEAVRPWVVAYGVRRGNARGEKDRDSEIGPLGELHTLFDRPASLHNAANWLKDLDADVLREKRKATDGSPGPREGVWNAVVKTLKKLLNVSNVEVDDDGLVFVHHSQFGRVRLEALSDGYLTTAGWVIDMIARWIDRQRELEEPVGANILYQMTGFVLIDEIDLHLHPMWQLRIIDDIRALFPRLSFIVTTHNPLTLQGARRGEIFAMRREGKRVEIAQKNIRPGQDVDRVLFEQFGVQHTFDKETRDRLDRHREMLEKGVPHDDLKRKKIEAEIAERLGDAGNWVTRARDTSPLRPEERSLLAPFLKKKTGLS